MFPGFFLVGCQICRTVKKTLKQFRSNVQELFLKQMNDLKIQRRRIFVTRGAPKTLRFSNDFLKLIAKRLTKSEFTT